MDEAQRLSFQHHGVGCFPHCLQECLRRQAEASLAPSEAVRDDLASVKKKVEVRSSHSNVKSLQYGTACKYVQ